MQSQRSSVAVGVMLVALLIWLVVRSHLPSPSSPLAADRVPTSTPGPAPDTATATRTPLPDTTAAPLSQSAPTPTASVLARSTPPQTTISTVAPLPSVPTAAADTSTASTETASINAIKVRRMITDYHTLTGENPVGTNAEIMAAVMGKNPRQAVLGPPDGLNLNSKGELIDDWGTPYFFHQLSKDVMEIHSAGPDRVMGTADDVVVR